MTDHAALALSTLVLKHLPLDEYTRDLTVSQVLERVPHGIASLITCDPSYYLVERKTLGQLAVTLPG
ncbi:MAG TPA: hypothetical protein VH372_19485 [Actinospica sp.]|jgi:hypothetical protein|nr:hypothetical protein [Actinospica sp.]